MNTDKVKWEFIKDENPPYSSIVYCKKTGKNIAIVFNDEDESLSSLIASAPNLLDALEKFTMLNTEHYKDIAGLIINAKEAVESAKKTKSFLQSNTGSVKKSNHQLKVGDEIELKVDEKNTEKVTIVDITPHPDLKGSFYYEFSNGVICRDVRLH